MTSIQIGVCNDDPRTINKTFTPSVSLRSIEVKDNCSIEKPIFILDYDSSYTSCNYLYCSDYKRYYYINDIVLAPGGKAEIICTSDPLMSFKDQINALTCYVSRISDSKQRAAYVQDGQFVAESLTSCSNIVFDKNPFNLSAANQKNFVLTVIGGSPSSNSVGGGN